MTRGFVWWCRPSGRVVRLGFVGLLGIASACATPELVDATGGAGGAAGVGGVAGAGGVGGVGGVGGMEVQALRAIDLLDGSDSYLDFDLETQAYLISVPYLLSQLTLVVDPPGAAEEVDWGGETLTLDENGEAAVSLLEGEETLTVSTRDGIDYNIAVDRAPKDGFEQTTYLKAQLPEQSGNFGRSVAIGRAWAVVGQPNPNPDGGKIVIFGQGTSEIPNDPDDRFESGDQFGYSVALDGNTIVVGAYLEDSNATGVDGDASNNDAPESGAAYVYVNQGGGWTQQAYLKASNTGAGDRFGQSLAIFGDTIVVGASQEGSLNGEEDDNSASSSGAAYVFVRDGTTWTQQAYLKASDASALASFGWSVDIDRDAVIVGARGEDSVEDNAGAAYVFVRTGTTWNEEERLDASDAVADDSFGESVAIYRYTVVVGADGVDTEDTDAGAVYVFNREDAGWTQEPRLEATQTVGNRYFFGRAVDIRGSTMIVAAPQENGLGIDSGAAFLFLRDAGGWEETYLKASNADSGDNFGTSVALGGGRLLIGARGESSSSALDEDDNDTADSGAAYLFQ